MRLTGTVFRAHHPRWSFAPTSGDGAALYGGRFNRPGVPTLYAAFRPETAWAEAQQALPFKPQPLTLCAYMVDCEDVADLTDLTERSARRIEPADLGCAWEDLVSRRFTPPSWLIADRLRDAGVAAIIVPSYAPGMQGGDRNVVFWQWADTPPHQVRVIDDDRRLPRDARSWEE